MTRRDYTHPMRWLLLAIGFAACDSQALKEVPDGGDVPADGGDVAQDDGRTFPDGNLPDVPNVGPSCGTPAYASDLVSLGYTLGAPSARYDGPAVVERSTPSELILAFEGPKPSVDGSGEPEDVLPRRAQIIGLGTRLLPVGAKVWLTKDPGVEAPRSPFSGRPPSAFSVRDKKDGRLLVGASYKTAASPPLPFGNGRVTCETVFEGPCGKARLRHSSYDVQGDVPVTIGDGETRTVSQGGIPYDVTVWAQEELPQSQSTCYDYLPRSGFALTFVAHDLAALAATLDVGPAPACGYGNVDAKSAGSSLTQVDYETPYEGPITFEQRETPSQPEVCDQFATVGFAAAVKATVCASAGLVPLPAAGEQRWLSRPEGKMSVLRASKNGPLIVAGAFRLSPVDSAHLSDLLGTAVQVRWSCAYAVTADLQLVHLVDVAFGMTPAVVVKAGEHAVVTIGGQQVDVWLSATPEPFLTVAAH